MSMTTYSTAAALRTGSTSPFGLPTAAASWQLLVPTTGGASGAVGYARGTAFHVAFPVTGLASAGADARIKAMQDRPPRGVPR